MVGSLEPIRIRIPSQLPVATVNVYLLRGDENVLVDAGPHHPDSWDYLKRRLHAHGLGVEDIDRILITHGHVDHYGQAGDIVEASGAEVWAHELDRELIRDFAAIVGERNEYYQDVLRATGLPEETLILVDCFFDYLKGLGRETPVAHTRPDLRRRLGLGRPPYSGSLAGLQRFPPPKDPVHGGYRPEAHHPQRRFWGGGREVVGDGGLSALVGTVGGA